MTCATILFMAATVLVVDDHPSFRRFARRLLQAAGFSVVDEAATARRHSRRFGALRPDVVLLDVLLPDTTGFELAETLARTTRRAARRADVEPERS